MFSILVLVMLILGGLNGCMERPALYAQAGGLALCLLRVFATCIIVECQQVIIRRQRAEERAAAVQAALDALREPRPGFLPAGIHPPNQHQPSLQIHLDPLQRLTEEQALSIPERIVVRIHTPFVGFVIITIAQTRVELARIKSSADAVKSCGICLSDFAEGDGIRALPICLHPVRVFPRQRGN